MLSCIAGTGSVNTQNCTCNLPFHSQSLEWMDMPGSTARVLADFHRYLHLLGCGLHEGESLAPQLLWIPSHVLCLVLQACGVCFQHCMYACCNHHKTHDADAVAESHASGAVTKLTSCSMPSYLTCYAVMQRPNLMSICICCMLSLPPAAHLH